jgi:hypothetical protein
MHCQDFQECKQYLLLEKGIGGENTGPCRTQGGAVNRGLKWYFSMYRLSCLIEAYCRPEKYWLVWAGPLANHLLNFTFIFLSDSLMAAAE